VDQQIVAPAALVPLFGGALNAFEQAQLVLVLGEPAAEQRPSAQQRLVRDLDGLPVLGIAVGDQEARVDEAPEQRKRAARQVVEPGAAAGIVRPRR
jgi:hypothetical protein